MLNEFDRQWADETIFWLTISNADSTDELMIVLSTNKSDWEFIRYYQSVMIEVLYRFMQ